MRGCHHSNIKDCSLTNSLDTLSITSGTRVHPYPHQPSLSTTHVAARVSSSLSRRAALCEELHTLKAFFLLHLDCHRREGDCSGCRRKSELHLFGFRHSAQIDCGICQEEGLRAPRQKHHLCRRVAFPLRGSVVPAVFQSCDVYIRNELYAMSCCQVAQPCSHGFL